MLFFLSTIKTAKVALKAAHKHFDSSGLTLLEKVLEDGLSESIKIINETREQFFEREQLIIARYKESDPDLSLCFEKMNEHTKYLNDGYHKLMQLYSFKDLGDGGNYDG